MAEHGHRRPGAMVPEEGEGEADIGTRWLAGILLGFFGVVIIAAIGAWFLIQDWVGTGSPPALSPPARSAPSSGPALQLMPAADLAKLRASEERRLQATEWIDRERGIVRIPIDEAMSLLVRRAAKPAPAKEAGP